jgi:hypothetical protein
MTHRDLEHARRLLCRLQDHIRDALLAARGRQAARFARVVAVTAADTIYHIDRLSEHAILDWFARHWPKAWPVEVVMEGLEECEPVTFPEGTPVGRTLLRCILDPIDGTRNIMYDKRSAWILAALSRFFPEGKALVARIEERLWDELYGLGKQAGPLVFDDQYICTGGQLYELMIGHDRFLADLRPMVFKKLKLSSALVCHPYDICTALIAQEAGCVIEAPLGGPLAEPLDTTSPVAWAGYANPVLARHVRPTLQRLIKRML